MRSSCSFALVKLTALALVACVGLGPLVLGAHLTAHVHRWCETHAALEEVGPGVHVESVVHPISAEEGSSEGLSVRVAEGVGSEAHEQCLVAGLGFRAVTVDAPMSYPVDSPELESPRLSEADAFASVAPLFFAPKASPPARS